MLINPYELTPNKKDIDIRSKLSLMFIALMISFLFDQPFIHFSLLTVLLGIGLLIQSSIKQLISTIIPLLPILLMIAFFSGFKDPEAFLVLNNQIILFHIGDHLALSIGGLKLGLTFIFRLINMVFMTSLLLKTTDLDDFIQLFHKLRLPYVIAFILTTAIRFIPELQKKRRLIIEAQTARGADFDSGNFFRRYYLQVSIMLPLIINAIIMADHLTIALLSRGFGYKNQWTNLYDIKLRLKDVCIIIFCLISGVSYLMIRSKTEWGRL